jgi:hypothetical protein
MAAPKKPMEQMNLIKSSAPGTYKVPVKKKYGIGTAAVSDKRTTAQKLKDAGKRSENPQLRDRH